MISRLLAVEELACLLVDLLSRSSAVKLIKVGSVQIN